MDIILKDNVEKLGYKNDLVTVKDGYARNFLIPKGLAIYASPGNLKMREETLKQRAHKEEKIRLEAEKMVKDFKGLNIKVGAKVGENGKIFGSVNSLQLSDALKKLGYDIDRKNIKIKDEPIKQVGSYTADVKIYKDIAETITFEVVED
jgi:large subunit ribosomal protein L9